MVKQLQRAAATLPMVLGLGCVTMATLTTRILHTRASA